MLSRRQTANYISPRLHLVSRRLCIYQEWLDHMQRKLGDPSKYKYVEDKSAFDAVDPDTVDHLLGKAEYWII